MQNTDEPESHSTVHASAAPAAAESVASGTSQAAHWRFMGMDAGSVTALVLSVATAVWQVMGYLLGPSIQFIPPTSITLRFWPTGDRASLALTATTMNYVNRGRKDYDGLVIAEDAEIRLNGREPISLKWWWFVAADGSPQQQAHPVVVPGAGVAAHETRFAPRIRQCADGSPCDESVTHIDFLPFEQFLALGAGPIGNHSIEIVLRSRVFERREREIVYTCQVRFDARMRDVMATQAKLMQALRAQGLRLAKIAEHEDFREYYSLPCLEKAA